MKVVSVCLLEFLGTAVFSLFIRRGETFFPFFRCQTWLVHGLLNSNSFL